MCVLSTRETPPLYGRQPKLTDEPPLKTVTGMRSASQYSTIFCTSCLSRGWTTTSATSRMMPWRSSRISSEVLAEEYFTRL